SSTTRTLCFTSPSLSLFELKIDLFEPLEVGAKLLGLLAQPRHVGIALGELVADSPELLVEPRDLVATGHDRGDRVAARPDGLRVVGGIRVVRGGRGAVIAVGGEPSGLREHRGGLAEGVGEAPRAAAAEGQRERDRRPRALHERGRSTVKRLPLPSWDSTVTRPPW